MGGLRPDGGTSDDSLTARSKWESGIASMPTELRWRLRDQARLENRSMGALIVDAVEWYLRLAEAAITEEDKK